MAKGKLDKTCEAMKGILTDTIDDLTVVAKKSSKGLLTTILEQGSENVSELLDVCGSKLKEKVKKHEQNTKEKSG